MTRICNIIYPAFALFASGYIAVSPAARALSPPPDGGYPRNNTAEGTDALFNLIPGQYTGVNNTAVGFDALFSTVTGSYNTAIGDSALFSNTFDYNTAVGAAALYYNTNGEANTAIGAFALVSNATGYDNTASGTNALFSNTTGTSNAANGFNALFNNTTGSSNTAMGSYALAENEIGMNNTALGVAALAGNPLHNVSGSNNTGLGYEALFTYTTGSNNTASGYQALYNDTTGNHNTADGQGALFSNTRGHNNTANGQNALRGNTTGSNNIALGSNAGINLTTGSNNIDIGNPGVAGDVNSIRIGTQGSQNTAFIAGISGATVPTGVAVIVDADGHLGTTTSSVRFKEAIQPMDKASEAILALKPVTFHYRHDLDPDAIPQFGLVAEEVEKVNPDLVVRDKEGKPYTVRYDAVNAMLLNEFLREHKAFVVEQCKVQEQGATIARLEQQIETLTAGLQKVSERLELSKPAQQTVKNP